MKNIIYSELYCVLYKKLSKDNINYIAKILFSRPKPKYRKGDLVKMVNGHIGIIKYNPTWIDSESNQNWMYIYKHGFGLELENSVFQNNIIYAIVKYKI